VSFPSSDANVSFVKVFPQHVGVTRRGTSATRTATALLSVALVAVLAGGCKDQQEKYCDAVKDHQQELGVVLGDGSPDALLKALPIVRDLADDAPEDLRDEWRTVIDAVAGLQKALDDAGVDAATYDRDHPPAGLTQGDKDAIDAAAARLASQATVTSLSAVDQQAKDVCGTPLQLG
jgi:hypothetical protein